VVDEDGFCLGEKRASEKSNEITAIPELPYQPLDFFMLVI
jgi:hypothetical protein